MAESVEKGDVQTSEPRIRARAIESVGPEWTTRSIARGKRITLETDGDAPHAQHVPEAGGLTAASYTADVVQNGRTRIRYRRRDQDADAAPGSRQPDRWRRASPPEEDHAARCWAPEGWAVPQVRHPHRTGNSLARPAPIRKRPQQRGRRRWIPRGRLDRRPVDGRRSRCGHSNSWWTLGDSIRRTLRSEPLGSTGILRSIMPRRSFVRPGS